MTFARRLALTAFVLATAAWGAAAADWPHWRGPAGDGSSPETGLPTTWSATDHVAWVAPMPGPSAATPAVVGDRVFVSSVDAATGDLVALALDIADGHVVWQRVCGKNAHWSGNDAASPSPVAADRAVFFLFGTGDLVAFDRAGTRLWARNLRDDFGDLALKFGYCSSPLLADGRLYVAVLRRPRPYGKTREGDPSPLDSFLLAIDPATGRDLWRCVRPVEGKGESYESYASPILHTFEGRSEILLAGGNALTGHDLATGRELWRFPYNAENHGMYRLVPSPLPVGDLACFAEPRGNRFFAVRPGAGLLGADALAWTRPAPSTDSPTPLYYQGTIYLLDGDGKTLYGVDPKTGQDRWKGKLETRGVFRASPTGADGKIYCFSEEAEVVVLAAGAEFRVLAHFALSDEAPARSSMAAAGGRLFVRTAKHLYCVGP